VIPTDLVGLGCVMLTRQVLHDVPFDPGLSVIDPTSGGPKRFAGPCLKFSNDAAAKGYRLFLVGDVVCTHLTRSKF